jgi:hypothetical protein
MPGITPEIVRLSSSFINSEVTLMEWLLTDNFEPFPRLKICMSEGGIGRTPAILERCDRAWPKYRHYTKSAPTDPSSTYFRDHVCGGFMEDTYGITLIDPIGVDNVMLEVDYAHVDEASLTHSPFYRRTSRS